MKKYYVELQDEPKACGAYCIYMILKYHGIHVELKSIKEKSRMDQNGISIRGMLECLKEYQVEAKGYQASLDNIKENVQLPCILHLVINNYGHYVVLYEIKDDEYIIGDPQKGLITLYEDELEKLYSLTMIAILHVGRIPEEKEQSYFQFIIESFQSFSHEILDFLLRGLSISILSLLGNMAFQIIIDDLDLKTPYFYMIILSFAYLLVHMIKISTEKNQSIHLIELQKVLDEDYVLQSVFNMLELPMSFYDQERGQLHSQILSLYQLSEMNIMLFENILLQGITLLLFLGGMVLIHPLLAFIVLLLFVVIAVYMRSQVPVMKRLSQDYLEKYYTHHHALLEWIENIFVLKRYQVKQRKNHYHDIYLDHALNKVERDKKSVQINTIVSYMIQISFFFVLLLGLRFFVLKKITLGQLVMFIMLLNSMLPSFLSLVSLFFEYHQMKLIYERYKNFKIEEHSEKEKIQETIQRIALDNVSFAYGYRENLLNHIDLTIEKTLYVKGNTGSGKSTLLKLLMGYDLRYAGDIYFNDQELRNIDLSSLYEHVGYENQTPTFFHATLYDNFLIDDEKRIKALLKSFGYLDLENMFYVMLNEDGSPLSQGQRQVVAIVRLFLRDFDVYILDEVFSHLDQRSAGRIYRYIVKNYSDKILIMVNHQTKLVNRNDDYVIIEKGKIKKKDD